MSFMNLSGGTGTQKKWWNYGNKERDGYSTRLVGNIVEIDLVPKTEFGSSKIERFDDGNPKRQIRLVIKTDDGEDINWDFGPGGRDKRKFDKQGNVIGGEDRRSNAMRALADAIARAVPGATDIEDALGMRIEITTDEPPEGFSFSAGHPRPWHVRINPNNKIEHRGCHVLPDWEREGGEVDAPPNDPPQIGTANPQLAASMAAAQEAVQRNNQPTAVGNQWAQDEMPPANIYDEDIPF